jgi:two-component system, chemotaxis family, chemotaxis protein CheY
MNTVKVFVADDMASARELMGFHLNILGIVKILEAATGNEAWKIIEDNYKKNNLFDIFLLDINMPGLNGIQLLKKIRELDEYLEVPVIMVSTENEKEVVLDAALIGATDYLIKPFTDEDFSNKITTALGK